MLFFLFYFILSEETDDEWDLDTQDEALSGEKAINWSETEVFDVLIIGSGPAGSTAALYSAKASRKTVVYTGETPGGQLTQTEEVKNFPTFRGNGTQLVKSIKEQAVEFGAIYRNEIIKEVNFKVSPKQIITQNNEGIKAKTVIIATGGKPRLLGLESEKKLLGRGVSTCAHCDGSFYKGKAVVVIGGGNVACQEALYLNNICAHVTIVVRGKLLRATKDIRDQIENEGIDVIYNAKVTEITGYYGASGIKYENTETKKKKSLCCSGVFIAIGQTPDTSLFSGKIKLDRNGYIVTDKNTRTNVKGVFAAGDCTDSEFKQAIVASADGCKASMLADKYLSENQS